MNKFAKYSNIIMMTLLIGSLLLGIYGLVNRYEISPASLLLSNLTCILLIAEKFNRP